MSLTTYAPGKLNLCLFLGPTRPDGLHEIASLFDSVSLHDTLSIHQLDAGEDRVLCRGVDGENLASRALRACREAGLLTGRPVEVVIQKRIPVAAGMGGGSADAAATLRLVGELEGRPAEDFQRLAFALGADVPSQLTPGASLVHGAGERVTAIDPRCLSDAGRSYVIIAQPNGLGTAEVFQQADRAGLPEASIADRENMLLETVSGGVGFAELCALVENALEPAILALRPELAEVPRALRDHGAAVAALTGSGPTCFGIFAEADDAERAAAGLTSAGHDAHVATPVGAEFAAVRPFEAG
ncbi:MAG: 4-(cytidine 5'-diphospho)-2-C-methyl-D-erythritol kinase [Solirubrobacterales bacterium]